MQKVEVEVENLKKPLIFFLTPHVLYYFQKVKNIYWASLDVEFHELSNCILKKCFILFFHRDIVIQSHQWFLIALTSTVRIISDGSVRI